MKVAQFNTFPYGGAATAARRIHLRLLREGVESKFYFHRNDKGHIGEPGFEQVEFPEPVYTGLSGSVRQKLQRKRQKDVYHLYNRNLSQRPKGGETFSMAQLPKSTPLDWSRIDADVVHLHWISFFADYRTFFASIPNRVPIVWTLHDMNAFTGGCHYSDGCHRFESGCGSCPQVIDRHRHDVSDVSFRVKQKALRNKQIHVVAPSDWMRELAMESDVWPKGTTFQTVRLGFDLKEFHPALKQAARKELGIESDALLIGFGAEDINNRRKGLQHLLPALTRLKTNRPVECVVFGSGEIEPREGLPKVHHFGYVNSAKQQSLIYSAADLVVVPSREDNQPQVGLEAMACGTPVVAFDAGGIPEYVRDGITGSIAKLGDEAALSDKLVGLIDNDSVRLTMGERARLMMEQEFELGEQAKKYLALYASVASNWRVARAA